MHGEEYGGNGAAYMAALESRVVIFDGAMGTNLQLAELSADDFGGPSLEGCNEMLTISRPDVVASIHDRFCSAGVDVIETDTFGANSIVLAEYESAGRAAELNLAGARIAREVAGSHSTPSRPRFVAGSMGPGTKLPSLGHIGFPELSRAYEEQAAALIEGGVDLLMIETIYDLLQAKAAVIGARRAMARARRRLPLQLQVTVESTGRMLVGSDIATATAALAPLRPDVLGLNCATGPREMSEHLRYLSEHWAGKVACLPNAGLPSVRDGRTHYDLTPEELATFHRGFVSDFGVSVIGGCCGTTPEHLGAVVRSCSSLEPAARQPRPEPGASSLFAAVPFRQQTSFLMIGERTNANGSRRFREAMLNADWETAERVAKDQVREGAHLLDVCVDYTGADGVSDMAEIASRFATAVPAPLVLDSTEAPVIEAGLQRFGGRAVLNSVNLEDGDGEGTRLDKFLRLAADHGAAVICTCIDERGQARSAGWKLDVASRVHEIATQRYGLSSGDLIFDPLALTLSTGMEESRRDAIETIEGIRRIKEALPGCFTTIGLSNVSFGFAPAIRRALNSVFLAECVAAGLDSAIVHAGGLVPLSRLGTAQREACADLVYDRRRPSSGDEPAYDPLEAVLRLFEGASPTLSRAGEDRSGWPVEQRLSARVVEGDSDGLERELDEALGSGHAALSIVNDVLLEGMRTVGELFGRGEMQLPFVLRSAETMKRSVAYLEPHMERELQAGDGPAGNRGKGGPRSKGAIVLATVKGDVHDIGKNLVDIILTNNGYTVHNLGIKVPLPEMAEAAQKTGADAIGMSGLLVKSTLIMRENLEELNNAGLSALPVILGGAALTRTYVERDLRQVYKGPVFYGKDAFEGLRTMDAWMAMKRAGTEDPDFGRQLGGRRLGPRGSERQAPAAPPAARSPEVAADNRLFTPPFVGSRIVKGIPIDDVASYVNPTALYRNQWGFRPTGGETDQEMRLRARPVLTEQLYRAKQEGLIEPMVAYGYFRAASVGNDLVIFSGDSVREEAARFSFPRQSEPPQLCIADFFRPLDSGEADYAAFHVVTIGPKASERAAELFAGDRYEDYLLLHGLGVEMAEALAEYWHRRVREEWGYAGEDGASLAGLFRQRFRGGRYSWGYPACPELSDNAKVVDLLGAERIGVTVTEGFQLHPEQTTSAIICHHPQAKYFVAR
ncbi:MAG: methionine synthase [Acidimicrobiales bacterium]